VAKHGNRNLSSKSGAADALTEMGLNVMIGPEVVERCLHEAGIGFHDGTDAPSGDPACDAGPRGTWHADDLQYPWAADQPCRGKAAS
jgi:hypothetical protein